MKLSVVILNYNVRYFLELCLLSVQKSISNLDAEIIVVDNNSTDDSCDMVKANFPKVILIENKDNSGFSKGNNSGVAIAKGDFVCILNPDTVVPENAFTELLKFADNQTNLGMVGCQLIDGTGAFLPESKRNIPTPNVALKKIFGNGNAYYSSLNPNEIGNVDILVGAFMLLKTEVYNEVGGFDEDYFMYGEDIDLSYKILKKGYQNYYYGNLSVIHFKGESTLKDKVYAKRFYGAMRLFYKKHFKSNVIMNALVNVGIKMASFAPQNNSASEIETTQTVIVSNAKNNNLEKQLQQPIFYVETTETIQHQSTIVLDARFLSFQKIINLMQKQKNISNSIFRIWPEGRNFILGSDSANARGEVIKF
ncbi:glycosyltransferase family 2 protein [Winogradskyella litorisediminis]|uniref:Glycosyltransferase family 2 protein n=1 Tax=Winogradskyella litorisediminis TaxID=1156618 RepID=A0ABW3NAW5_9FLAO